MGSGSLAAISILEAKYKDTLTREEGIALVTEAIEAGIVHDMGSGGNVDVTVITSKGAEIMRNLKTDYKRIYYKPGGYKFPVGDTPIISSVKITFDKLEKMEEEFATTKGGAEKMEIMK